MDREEIKKTESEDAEDEDAEMMKGDVFTDSDSDDDLTLRFSKQLFKNLPQEDLPRTLTVNTANTT